MFDYYFSMNWSNLFCSIAELLGVKIYKKYWPDGGSYWNTKHVNKNNETDLKLIIDQSIFLLKIHFSGLLNEFLIMISCVIVFSYFNAIDEKYLLSILFIYGIILSRHLYGIMVHRYNIIKANERLIILLSNTKKNSTSTAKDLKINTNKCKNKYWIIDEHEIIENTYIYIVKNYQAGLYFKFDSKEKANKFYQSISMENSKIIQKMALDEKQAIIYHREFNEKFNTNISE